MNGKVAMIRVDLPSLHAEYKGSFAYFFISIQHCQEWHPWWKQLFGFLLELERHPDGLHPDGEEMEIARMSGTTRQRFLELLQSAPPSEVARHQTLRTALRRLPLSEADLPVRYFGPSPKPPEPT